MALLTSLITSGTVDITARRENNFGSVIYTPKSDSRKRNPKIQITKTRKFALIKINCH